MTDSWDLSSQKEKVNNFIKWEWKSSTPASKCTICGTQQTDAALEHDPRFWVQSATYPELVKGSQQCPWCQVLRLSVERCVAESPDVLHRAGYLDWGRDPFSPVWRAEGNVVEIEIFVTQGMTGVVAPVFDTNSCYRIRGVATISKNANQKTNHRRCVQSRSFENYTRLDSQVRGPPQIMPTWTEGYQTTYSPRIYWSHWC